MLVKDEARLPLLSLQPSKLLEYALCRLETRGELDLHCLAVQAAIDDAMSRQDPLHILKQNREGFRQAPVDPVRAPVGGEEDGRVMKVAERRIAAHALK